MDGIRPSIRWLSLLTLLVGLAGCGILGGEAPDRTTNMTPQQLYAEAKDEMSNGKYSEAVKLLGKLESRYPFGAWAQQAQIDTAFAYYKDGNRVEALVAVERFVRLHPTSELLDYAYYLKGLINFNEEQGFMARFGGQDLSERDQRAARESFESFRQVVTRFPNSKYYDDSAARMKYLVNAMAAGEAHIARYYYLRGAYVATVGRAQTVLQQYPQTPAVEEALYLMLKSYEKLQLEELRADTERVFLKNYPNSQLLTQGVRVDDRSWWEVWR
jgi:outer membrane protein assembly factor BamD